MKNYLSGAVLMTALFVWGCGSSEEKTASSETANNWEFVKVDSLQFEIIGRPILADAEFGKILLYDPQKREFVILDDKGVLINRFVKTGDSPDNFGFQLLLPGFLSESEVIMAGTLGIFVYDLSGNFIKKIPHPEPQSGGTFTDNPGKSIDHFYLNGKNKIISKSFRTYNSTLGDSKFYQNYQGIELTDAESGTGKAVIPFAPKSRFLNGNGFIQSDFEPAFATNNSGVFLAFAGDPVLHEYKWTADSLSLKKSVSLSLPDFGEITGQPLEKLKGIGFSTNTLTASILKVVPWKDKVLVQFFPGLSTEEDLALDQDYKNGNEEEAKAKITNLFKNRKVGLTVVDPAKSKQVGIIDFPDWVNANGFVLDGENFWFVKRFNPDAEEDFIKLYKAKLIEK